MGLVSLLMGRSDTAEGNSRSSIADHIDWITANHVLRHGFTSKAYGIYERIGDPEGRVRILKQRILEELLDRRGTKVQRLVRTAGDIYKLGGIDDVIEVCKRASTSSKYSPSLHSDIAFIGGVVELMEKKGADKAKVRKLRAILKGKQAINLRGRLEGNGHSSFFGYKKEEDELKNLIRLSDELGEGAIDVCRGYFSYNYRKYAGTNSRFFNPKNEGVRISARLLAHLVKEHQGNLEEAINIYLGTGDYDKILDTYLEGGDPEEAAGFFAVMLESAKLTPRYFDSIKRLFREMSDNDKPSIREKVISSAGREGYYLDDVVSLAKFFRSIGEEEVAHGIGEEFVTGRGLGDRGRGEIAECMGDIPGAIEYFQSAGEYNSAGKLARSMGDFSTAIRCFLRGKSYFEAYKIFKAKGQEAFPDIDEWKSIVIDLAEKFTGQEEECWSYDNTVDIMQYMEHVPELSEERKRDIIARLARVLIEKGKAYDAAYKLLTEDALNMVCKYSQIKIMESAARQFSDAGEHIYALDSARLTGNRTLIDEIYGCGISAFESTGNYRRLLHLAKEYGDQSRISLYKDVVRRIVEVTFLDRNLEHLDSYHFDGAKNMAISQAELIGDEGLIERIRQIRGPLVCC